MAVTIRGASDDLVLVQGDLNTEFGVPDSDDDVPFYLGFSDGTLLSVTYDGCWRISLMARGSAPYNKVEAEGIDAEEYSDVVTLNDSLTWCVAGDEFVSQLGRPKSRKG